MKKRLLSLSIILCLTALAAYAFGPRQEPPPKTSDIKPPEDKPYKLPNGDIKLGEITLHTRTKEISFPGFLNPPDLGTLEILLVSPPPYGRSHEGLVVTDASPFQLEAMLYMMGAKNDKKRNVKGKKGDLINIDLEWKDENGQLHREPIENWVLDERTDQPMVRKGFYFVGSSFHNDIYQAEGNGNLCLLYSNTPATVLDCADKDSDRDILYVTNPAKLQPGGYREVRVILSIRKER